MSKGTSIRNWPKVIFFGDSLTQYGFSETGGWVSIIADALQRKCDVINRGFSGYNSRWNKMILPKLITEEDACSIAAVAIFLGANDSNLPSCTQHIPIEDYKNNIISMVKYLESIGVTKDKVILIGPPPCDEQAWSQHMSLEGNVSTQDNKYKQQYAVGCRMIAADLNVTFIDLYLGMMKESNWKSFLCDGLHFSKEGSGFLADQLLPHIQKLTKNLPLILPDWKAVDPENPEQSFL